MSKNKFKAGDRVRIVADVEQPYSMWVEKGDTGVIVDGKPADGFECVKIDGIANKGYVCVENKYLETDSIYDSKTAFLSELKELLEKYDAKIEAYSDNIEPVTMEIHIGCTSIEFGESSNFVRIGYDNIMDYDKE